MIITQTPFRMSFFGGGTDFPDFYKKHGGAVISTTFDKYCYVNVRHLPRFFDYSTELSYSVIERVTDVEDMVAKMLDQIRKQGMRLLITIDEVVYSEQMKVFVSAFQIFMRQDYPIFLLMTGLYENIYELQNDKSLTFLYRAPKIILEPLSLTAVCQHYMDIFRLDKESARKMAALTRGYPFAFQVLGYLYWEHRDTKTVQEILPEYDQYLEEYVYSKIWSEMSEKDKEIMQKLAESGEIKVKDLREQLEMSSEQFSVYRERLKRKGVIDTRKYGKISMALPRFEDFIKMRMF